MYKVTVTSNTESLTWADDCSGTTTIVDPAGRTHRGIWGENDYLKVLEGDENLLRAAGNAHGPKCPEGVPYEQTLETLKRWGFTGG